MQDRRVTMARFAEPDDPVAEQRCVICDEDLFAGQEVYKAESMDYLCSTECAFDYYEIKKEII